MPARRAHWRVKENDHERTSRSYETDRRRLSDLAERERNAAAMSGLPNSSIDERRLLLPEHPNFHDVPCCIYFYYVRVNSNGRVSVTHHFYPGGDPDDPNIPPNHADWPSIARDPSNLTPILEMLAADARASGAHIFEPIGSGFQDIQWRRKSYIAFFIDEANWTLHPKDGINFVTDSKGGEPGTPNHTFYDSLYLPLTMLINGGPATDQRSAVVFINHMKADVAGNDLSGNDPPQLFHFQMVLDVGIENSADRMIVIFDPDGNNMGPPLPPP